MRKSRRSLVVSACLILFAATAASAGQDGLLDMIGLMPENPLTYRSIPLFSYVDFRAVEAAAGVKTPADERSFNESPETEREAWMRGLFRVKTGPPPILRYAARVGVHAKTSFDAIGPDWFMVDRAMGIWQAPPHGVTLVAGDEDMTDAEGFNFVLPPRGFVRDEVDGVPVWHRFADDAIASQLKDEVIEGDIFDTEMMAGLRIAVLPGMLAAAGTWPDLRAVLAVESGKAKPAVAVELLRPMIEALGKIEGADGPAIQAMAFTLPDVGLAPSAVDRLVGAMAGGVDPGAIAEEIGSAMETGQSRPPLPAYPLALFADFADRGDQLVVIALPYADRPTAEAAATVLADRLNTWQPGNLARTLLAEIGGRLETEVVEDASIAPAVAATFGSVMAAMGSPDEVSPLSHGAQNSVGDGGAVALVAVRYPLPAEDYQNKAGVFLAAVQLAIFNRDFTPLAVP